MAVDPVTEARSIIEVALRGVEEETHRLERALDSFGGHGPRASTPVRAPKRRRRRTKPGQRREQFLAAVKEQPGITVTQPPRSSGSVSQCALRARQRLSERARSRRRGVAIRSRGPLAPHLWGRNRGNR